jgi:cytochrome c-type biogenesis protein CcmE
MTRKRLRLYLVLASLVVLGIAATLILRALSEDLVYFRSPTDVAGSRPDAGALFRLGGLVETGTVEKQGEQVTFSVTDLTSNVTVTYRGLLPDLFREGQGVIVEGAFDDSGQFVAREVLAKHDETYMPPEVAKALKESGRWQETEGKGTTAGSQ